MYKLGFYETHRCETLMRAQTVVSSVLNETGAHSAPFLPDKLGFVIAFPG